MGCSEDFYPVPWVGFLRHDSCHHVSAADPRRRKDGKTHVYWNIVGESRRLDDEPGGAATQVLYLGGDPFVAGRRLASSDRGIRHGVRRAANACLCSPRIAARLGWPMARLGGASLPVKRSEAVPAAAMGGVLAGGSAVARAAKLDRFWTSRLRQAEEGDALGPGSPGFWWPIG